MIPLASPPQNEPFIKVKYFNGYSIIFIIIMLILPMATTARGFDFKKGKENTVINFQNINGLVILPFKIGNSEVNLILDTGIRNIILFDRRGSYGLNPDPDKQILFSGIGTGKTIRGKIATEVKMESNDIEGSGLAVVIIPQNDFSKKLNMEVHGLIGYDIFSRFLVTIDYKNNQLILSRTEDKNPINYQQMNLILVDSKPYLVSNLSIPGIEDKSYTFFIDTGAGYDLTLNHNPYSGNKKKKKVILGSGLTGDIKGTAHFVRNMYIGNFYFNNFLITIPSSGVYIDKELMADRDGTLGGKFLERFDKVVFDYSNQKIYFQTGTLLADKTNFQ